MSAISNSNDFIKVVFSGDCLHIVKENCVCVCVNSELEPTQLLTRTKRL